LDVFWGKTGSRGLVRSPAAGPSTYRRTMWRLSNAQALIFIAAVAVMVALAVWMAL
jgi:hypothetical protein